MLNMPEVKAPKERLSEWSPLREGMARLQDAVAVLSANVIASTGNKPPAVKGAPRPVTAMDRARRRRREQEHQDLVARVLKPV